MSPGKESFQLLRKVGENSLFQETRIVVALRLKNPEMGRHGGLPLLGQG
jgi:hypothetical protein